MSDGGSLMGRIGSHPQFRWAAWLTALVVYTYLLCAPNEWLPPWLQHTVGVQVTDEVTLGKFAHAGAYAFLTLLTFWLPIGWSGRAACVTILVLHGGATEYVQTLVPSRHGCWTDVGIDEFGVAVGLLLGGLGRGRRQSLGAGGSGRERVLAAPQADAEASRENAQADPL
jgi:VanZ family protein